MLQTQSVSFKYRGVKRRQVLKEVEFTLPKGSRVLLLGPNGAGKSTLLKLLCGYEKPSSGSVSVGGVTSNKALRSGVSWMPQDARALRGLSVHDQMEYAGWLCRLSRKDSQSKAADILRRVRLADKRHEAAASLSGGQMRRLALGQALMSPASFLLLDEPTAGLDPAQSANFREMLTELSSEVGLLISTHLVADIDGLFDRVVVILDGSIRFDGTLDEFRALGPDAESSSLASVFTHVVSGGLH